MINETNSTIDSLFTSNLVLGSAMADFTKLPKEMTKAKRWLVWRNKDGCKLPYYINGTNRGKGGKLDSVKDVKQLSTFDDAVTAFNTGKYSGIGFALGKDGEGHWQGIDLDKVTENNLQHLSGILPGYVESSPSGKGFHAIGYGTEFKGLGSNGTATEAYSGKRYFTVTGEKVRGEICDISEFVADVIKPIHDVKHNSLPIEDVEHTELTDLHDSHDLQIYKQGREEKERKKEKPLNIVPIHELPERCKPQAYGARNQVIFNLARHLKSLYQDSVAKDFHPYVKEWHTESLPNIRTKGFTETWADFCNAWKGVKTLEGESIINQVASNIDFDTVAPHEYHEKGYEDSGWACLQLCYGLSTYREDKTFFLSGRKVEEVLKIPQRTAAKILNLMVTDAILSVIEKGDRHKATTYQYIGMTLKDVQ